MGRTIEETGIHEDPTKSSTGLIDNTADADTVNKDAQTDDIENEDSTMSEIDILVAYFSATNTTEDVAEYIANELGADLYEIAPEETYTDTDLSYNDDSSRGTIETNGPSSRPAIPGGVKNMEQYDIVSIGYPIWWGEAPKTVGTFMESYDFSGKTSIPFYTFGDNGLGFSASSLAELIDGVQWFSDQRLGGGSSQDEAIEWVNGLGLAVSTE